MGSHDALVPVTHADRHARHQHRGAVVWLTGLPAAGKSTLALALERSLFDRDVRVCVLDGDELRRGVSSDLGFSRRDRAEHARRVAEIARLFADAGNVVVVALVSPYEHDRRTARVLVDDAGCDFIEVYVDAPVAVCQARDPKGLYRRARSNEVTSFTGVTDTYEPPERPDVHVRTDLDPPSRCVEAILERLLAAISVGGAPAAKGDRRNGPAPTPPS